jgi:flagellar protein FlgJ
MDDITSSLPGVSPLLRFNQQLGGIQERIESSRKATGNARLHELKNATQQFEALFVSYLMKVMRSTIDEADPEATSFGKEIYTEMFDSEIANNISQTQSLGIGDLLYNQLEQLESGRPEKSSDLRMPTMPFPMAQPSGAGVSSPLPASSPANDDFPVGASVIPVSSAF